jgi:maltodextrin utilization protein YvdJ|tara:strand:+ start:32 stop:319 length:288 start_codon:yes stop_codon:yes gene_type:complete
MAKALHQKKGEVKPHQVDFLKEMLCVLTSLYFRMSLQSPELTAKRRRLRFFHLYFLSVFLRPLIISGFLYYFFQQNKFDTSEIIGGNVSLISGEA